MMQLKNDDALIEEKEGFLKNGDLLSYKNTVQ